MTKSSVLFYWKVETETETGNLPFMFYVVPLLEIGSEW